MAQITIHPLERFRKTHKPQLSQADVAEAILASTGTISRAERGLAISEKQINRLVEYGEGAFQPKDFTSTKEKPRHDRQKESRQKNKGKKEAGAKAPRRRR